VIELICGSYGFSAVVAQSACSVTGWTGCTGCTGWTGWTGWGSVVGVVDCVFEWGPGGVVGVVLFFFSDFTLASPGPAALTITAVDLSTITGAWLWSVNTTTARRLSGLLNMTRGPSTSTSAPWKLAFSVGPAAG
jgi:hypothetical protein